LSERCVGQCHHHHHEGGPIPDHLNWQVECLSVSVYGTMR
jgi:hypothetical protein